MSSTPITPGTWTVDPSHSSVTFVARHLMVSKVRGSFGSFAGTITIADDLLASKVEATVDVASVTTGESGRDEHLRSGDFFELEQFPTWSLVSTGLRADGDDYVMTADLTIKGVTRPVEFEVEFEGMATDPWGNVKAGFEAKTEINRTDFGLTWNAALEAGGVLVGEKVKIELDIQAVKAA